MISLRNCESWSEGSSFRSVTMWVLARSLSSLKGNVSLLAILAHKKFLPVNVLWTIYLSDVSYMAVRGKLKNVLGKWNWNCMLGLFLKVCWCHNKHHYCQTHTHRHTRSWHKHKPYSPTARPLSSLIFLKMPSPGLFVTVCNLWEDVWRDTSALIHLKFKTVLPMVYHAELLYCSVRRLLNPQPYLR